LILDHNYKLNQRIKKVAYRKLSTRINENWDHNLS
jgi:hypothetical protein